MRGATTSTSLFVIAAVFAVLGLYLGLTYHNVIYFLASAFVAVPIVIVAMVMLLSNKRSQACGCQGVACRCACGQCCCKAPAPVA